jgi:hypothetical protein
MRLKPTQRIPIEEGDAADFIHFVNAVMESMYFANLVDEVVFVKVKNWFDHKWLNYSGKSIVPKRYIGGLDTGREETLDSAWLEETTIPPFNPNRVIYSKFFRSAKSRNEKVRHAIHIHQRSTENRQRFVQDYTENGLLVWFSSNTLANHRGSLMVYLSKDGIVRRWYAGFVNSGGWELSKVKGINADTIREMIGHEMVNL